MGRGARGGLLFSLVLLALGGAPGCASVEKDLEHAKSNDGDDRRQAAQSLAEHITNGSSSYVARRADVSKMLRTLLDDKSALVRMTAVDALVETEGKDAAAVLVDRLRDRDPWVRLAAVKGLGRVGDATATEPLAGILLHDESADVRRAAAEALGQLKAQGALYDLYLALSDAKPAVRFHAWLALRAITGKDYGLDAKAWREVVPRQR